MIEPSRALPRKWILYGMTASIVGLVAYILAAAGAGLPDRLVLILALSFGPLLSFAYVGFYHFFVLHKKSLAAQAGAIFGVIAGTIVHLMLVIQMATREAVPEAAREELGLAWDAVNNVQLGMDVSWDIYLSVATIFLSVAMFSHPRFGRVWSAITFLLAAGLLVLNIWTFPTPPADAGFVDLGPVIGLWYGVVAVRVLTSLKWVDQRLASGTVSPS